jgi:Uncharacterised protein family (UPF0175)
VTITVEIPDEFASQIVPKGQDPARAAIEAIALHGYRSDRLTESDIRRLLGFETRMEVHGFLKEHGAFLPYTVEDLNMIVRWPARWRSAHKSNTTEIRRVNGAPGDCHRRH